MSQPLAQNTYLLKRFPGKGGWTYAEIPEIPMDKSAPFGWVRVKGSIDQHTFEKYHLMPMGNGKLFFPVKSEIRKKIKKQAGDFVTITLFADDSYIEIIPQLQDCLAIEPNAEKNFHQLTTNQQQEFLKWISGAKNQEIRDERLGKTIDLLLSGKSLRK